MDTIGFIGAGNMAECLVRGIITAGLYAPDNILVSDIRPERLEYLAERYGVRTAADNAELAAEAAILVLSVKPQNMPDALKSIKNRVRPGTLVVSIAAGIRISKIADALGDIAIVRVMPNTPALIGAGVSALFANAKAQPTLPKAQAIFSSVGSALVLDNEDLMDAVTAVSGSGPAYYFLLTEEIIKAAQQLGLDSTTAVNLVLQTAKGSALLALEAVGSGRTVEQLRRNVTSPGGTTEAAMEVLIQGRFGHIIQAAVAKAYDKSRQLST
ncbi:MAG TPA: pyrroline-5-carboxylate reductase [Sedimentisphaerales bacterium]|nr:pyrroline-5-carboxylate reductase [Sedimentisphaerales bacterium]